MNELRPTRHVTRLSLRLGTILLLGMLLLAAGCAEEATKNGEDSGGASSGDSSAAVDSLAIVGDYEDEYASTHQITEDTWTQGGLIGDSVFTITSYDNTQRFLVAQNGADNAYSAELWSQFDWVYDGEDLYFCQIAYDAATEEEAAAVETADEGDLLGGCNGVGWSLLTPVVL